jgi:TolB-like protein
MRRCLLLAFFSLALPGCATVTGSTGNDPGDSLMQANHRAVDQLLANIPPSRALNRKQPIIVASLVNIDDLGSSRLGRMLSEQLATRLSQSGYAIVELKLRDSIFVKQLQGELLLSREIKDITLTHKAQAVLVGTYAESSGQVYLTIKLVGVGDNLVISAQDYLLPLDSNVRSLLWNGPRQQ